MKQPTNPKEYWELVKLGEGMAGLAGHTTWEALRKQLETIMGSDTATTINDICELPFPSELGLCDSQEYDTMRAGVIQGLQKMLLTQGIQPPALPPNAPQPATLVRSGSMMYYTGGSARAQEEYHRKEQASLKATKKAIEALDSTQACREVLAKHYPDTKPSDWKRGKKFKQSDKIFRNFTNPQTAQEVTVIYDPDEDLKNALRIEEESTEPTGSKTTFPKVFGPYRSGNVYFSVNVEEADEITFFCGPETKEGGLDDLDDPAIFDVLREIFKDYDIDIATSENHHHIRPNAGQSMKELREVLISRIASAGATMYDDEDYD